MFGWFERHWGLSLSITLFGAMLMFYISSLTFPPSGPGSIGFKALAYHFLAYFCFSLFLLISIVQGTKRKLIIPSMIVAFVYAVSDEMHQLLVPGRAFSLGDILVDTIGIMAATLVYCSCSKRLNKLFRE